MIPPRIRLRLDGEAAYGERRLFVGVLELDGGERAIGYIDVPVEAVSQLGALGVLIGLGVFSALEIVGDGAPSVYQLSAREARLLKIAAKVLG